MSMMQLPPWHVCQARERVTHTMFLPDRHAGRPVDFKYGGGFTCALALRRGKRRDRLESLGATGATHTESESRGARLAPVMAQRRAQPAYRPMPVSARTAISLLRAGSAFSLLKTVPR